MSPETESEGTTAIFRNGLGGCGWLDSELSADNTQIQIYRPLNKIKKLMWKLFNILHTWCTLLTTDYTVTVCSYVLHFALPLALVVVWHSVSSSWPSNHGHDHHQTSLLVVVVGWQTSKFRLKNVSSNGFYWSIWACPDKLPDKYVSVSGISKSIACE
jgi:hypothetical protein